MRARPPAAGVIRRFRAVDDPAPVFRHGVRRGMRAAPGSGCQARADSLASRDRCRAHRVAQRGPDGPWPARPAPVSRNLAHPRENPYRRPWSGTRCNRRRRPDTRGTQAQNRRADTRRTPGAPGNEQPDKENRNEPDGPGPAGGGRYRARHRHGESGGRGRAGDSDRGHRQGRGGAPAALRDLFP